MRRPVHPLRFVLMHAAIGHGAAALFTAALLFLDLGGLATLVRASDLGVVAVAALFVALGSTFAGVQIAVAVMWDAEDEER